MTGLPARSPQSPPSADARPASEPPLRSITNDFPRPAGPIPHPKSPASARRPVCLVLPAEERRGLPQEFGSELQANLPEVEFVTERGDPVDCVWIMGCPASDFSSVEAMRREFPDAYLLVTSRDLSAARAQALQEAGADCALNWAGTLVGVRRALRGELQAG